MGNVATGITRQSPFARRTALLLIGIGASAFIGGMIVMAFSDLFDPNSGGRANSFSSSAIGHQVVVEMLRDLGIPITLNRRDMDRIDISGDVLVLAEPQSGRSTAEYVERSANFTTTILVLTKRFGIDDPLRPNWLAQAPLLSLNVPQSSVRAFVPDAAINRLTAPEDIQWTSQIFQGLTPALPEDLQLITSPSLTPLLSTEEGILIGEMSLSPAHRLVVVSDPDLIANHGIDNGDNAAIFAQLIDRLAASTIYWDETIHGFVIADNIWRSAFEPPLVAITITATLTLLILLLATTYRFGSPLEVAPPLSQGKQSLVHSTASLLADARHTHDLLERYLTFGLRDAMRALNARTGVLNDEAIEWLERLGNARGLGPDLAAVPRRIRKTLVRNNTSRDELTLLVEDFYLWKTEIFDGPGINQDRR